MKSAPPSHDPHSAPPRGGFSSSGRLTPVLVGLVCLALLSAAFEFGHGHLHLLKSAVDPPLPPAAVAARPGGQDVVRLSRSATAIGSEPEFLSATLLPGRGLSFLQITAAIPGHGEVPLLMAPSLAEAARQLTGTGDDAAGERSSSFGAAFQMPWAGHLSGTESSNPSLLQTQWQGRTLNFPAAPGSNRTSVEGLLLKQGADSVLTDVLPDGQRVHATFSGAAIGQFWPSPVATDILVELSGHTLEITFTARNTGTQPVPFGSGWHPYFAIPSGDRNNVSLRLPSQTIAEYNHSTGIPSGHSGTVADTPLDFVKARGTPLGAASLNETFVNLQSGLLSDGPIAEMREAGFNYTLRLIPVTANLNTLHVTAPADKTWVSIAPATNTDDPLGPQWGHPEESGLITLKPGATVTWKLRLEIAGIGSAASAIPAVPPAVAPER